MPFTIFFCHLWNNNQVCTLWSAPLKIMDEKLIWKAGCIANRCNQRINGLMVIKKCSFFVTIWILIENPLRPFCHTLYSCRKLLNTIFLMFLCTLCKHWYVSISNILSCYDILRKDYDLWYKFDSFLNAFIANSV